MALQVVFSGPSPASNAIDSVGSAGNYFGTAPDFLSVAADVATGTYQLTVVNYTGVSGWPVIFKMTKSDAAPGEVIGTYALDGGTGSAVVS